MKWERLAFHTIAALTNVSAAYSVTHKEWWVAFALSFFMVGCITQILWIKD